MSDIPWDLEYFKPDVAPADVAATAATDVRLRRFTAHWVSSTRAESYRLDVSTSPTFSSFVPGYHDLEVASLAKIVDGLSSNVQYYYRVRAVNFLGTSANSNTISVTTAIIATPTDLGFTARGLTTIDLSWIDNSPFETAYQVERDGVVIEAALPADSDAYHDSGLTEDTEYTYRVRAVDDDVVSDWSDPLVVSTSTIAQPTALATSYLGMTRIDLSWVDNATTEANYQVERDGVIVAAALAANSVAYADTGLTPNTAYAYRVRAINGAVLGPWSAVLNVTTILPSGIANYQLWLDATNNASITEVAGAVSAWADRGGNGRSVTQATAGKRPIKTAAGINGLQVIRFDAVDDLLTLAPWPAGAQLNGGSTVFVVVNPFYLPSAVRNFPLLRWVPSNAAGMQAESSVDGNVPSRNKLEAFVGTNAGLKRATPAVDFTNAPQLKVAVTSTTQISLYKNGVLEAGPTGGYVSITSSTGDTFNISHAEVLDNQRSEQDIGEIIIVSRAMGAAERADIESYLMTKWGL